MSPRKKSETNRKWRKPKGYTTDSSESVNIHKKKVKNPIQKVNNQRPELRKIHFLSTSNFLARKHQQVLEELHAKGDLDRYSTTAFVRDKKSNRNVEIKMIQLRNVLFKKARKRNDTSARSETRRKKKNDYCMCEEKKKINRSILRKELVGSLEEKKRSRSSSSKKNYILAFPEDDETRNKVIEWRRRRRELNIEADLLRRQKRVKRQGEDVLKRLSNVLFEMGMKRPPLRKSRRRRINSESFLEIESPKEILKEMPSSSIYLRKKRRTNKDMDIDLQAREDDCKDQNDEFEKVNNRSKTKNDTLGQQKTVPGADSDVSLVSQKKTRSGNHDKETIDLVSTGSHSSTVSHRSQKNDSKQSTNRDTDPEITPEETTHPNAEKMDTVPETPKADEGKNDNDQENSKESCEISQNNYPSATISDDEEDSVSQRIETFIQFHQDTEK